jgi:hypothetical protein
MARMIVDVAAADLRSDDPKKRAAALVALVRMCDASRPVRRMTAASEDGPIYVGALRDLFPPRTTTTK